MLDTGCMILILDTGHFAKPIVALSAVRQVCVKTLRALRELFLDARYQLPDA